MKKNNKNLDLKSFKNCTPKDLNNIVSEFDDHISIKKIKDFFPDSNLSNFDFETVSMEEVPKEVLNLNIKRSFTSGSIPATILKQSLDIYLPYVTKFVNYTINEGKFPAELKHSEVMPLFKKEEPLKKKNYRPVSLMPHLSKVFEIIIYKQINLYTEHKLSKFISFRKLHGRKQSLDIYLPYTTKSVNYAISEGTFSAELKHFEVISLLKKGRTIKEREL